MYLVCVFPLKNTPYNWQYVTRVSSLLFFFFFFLREVSCFYNYIFKSDSATRAFI